MVTAVVLCTSHALFRIALYTSATLLFEVPRVNEAMIYFWIGLGSALGGMARYWCSGLVIRLFGETFPWGTLIVNVTGSLAIGFLATWLSTDSRFLIFSEPRSFLMIGFLGGYTTFSSFSLQTLYLARDGEWLLALANIFFSVTLCLIAVFLGHTTASHFGR